MNWSYLFRQWFSTLILAPIITKIYELNSDNNYQIFDFFELFFAFLFVGMILLSPKYFLYGFIFHILEIKKMNIIISKTI